MPDWAKVVVFWTASLVFVVAFAVVAEAVKDDVVTFRHRWDAAVALAGLDETPVRIEVPGLDRTVELTVPRGYRELHDGEPDPEVLAFRTFDRRGLAGGQLAISISLPVAADADDTDAEEWQYGAISRDGGESVCVAVRATDDLAVGVAASGPGCSVVEAVTRTLTITSSSDASQGGTVGSGGGGGGSGAD